MKLNFQNNIIGWILTNILSIDEKLTNRRNIRWRWKIWKMGIFQKIPLRYLLSAYHRRPIWSRENNILMSEKEKNNLSISSWTYLKSWIEHDQGIQMFLKIIRKSPLVVQQWHLSKKCWKKKTLMLFYFWSLQE